MANVHWIKTGQRGARAEFNDGDIITTLLLLHLEPMGRYNLQKELAISDSSTKSLLNYCKKKQLLEIASKKGHKLTSKGRKIVDLIKQVILKHKQCSYEFFPNIKHYILFIAKIDSEDDGLFQQQKQSSWKYRDIAIAYGADSILLLHYQNDNLQFPERDMNLDDFYPDFKNFFKEKLALENQNNYYLLIVASNKIEIARKSAIITALHFYKNIMNEILKDISNI
ncbi:MAG: DUF4443 domain-containing protein [Asgard group archaeon]|nr:DUF4443 domain-containing protein [Asgard group archaeon]